MNNNWWRSLDDLDDDQKAFIMLPSDGKHLLEGPPGSGKTNLLLLRAQFMAGQGDKNVLILTYTKTLTDFIRAGISTKGLISSSQIRTYHSWAAEHVLQHLGRRAVEKEEKFDDVVRNKVLKLVLEANEKLPTKNLFSAIFVDEAQDLTTGELEALLCLSDRVCICGDSKQGIYHKDGLEVAEALCLTKHVLKRHFRIGQKIAHVADRLPPASTGENSLEATSNYDPKTQGISTAKMHVHASRDEQFTNMLSLVRVQLDAFNEDTIGIFCGAKETRGELRQRFDETDLAGEVLVHGVDEICTFSGKQRIHVLTIHAAKGTEFRAVHMYATEELATYPLNRSRLAYTAITRAKTALHAYRTGETSKGLENAFSEPTKFKLEDLFPGDA